MTLDDLLRLCPAADRDAVRTIATHDGVAGLLVYDRAGRTAAFAYGPDCEIKDRATAIRQFGEGFVADYRNAGSPVIAYDQEMPAAPKSRTQQAVALVDKGMAVHAAAKQVGISHSAVFRALAVRETQVRCPCCGQSVRPGFKIDRSKLRG